MLQPFQKTFSNQTDLLESSLNNPNSLKPPKFSSFQDKPTSTFEARIINSSYLLPTRKKSKLFSKGTCQTPALKYIETESEALFRLSVIEKF
jgi:hypothetical protein